MNLLSLHNLNLSDTRISDLRELLQELDLIALKYFWDIIKNKLKIAWEDLRKANRAQGYNGNRKEMRMWKNKFQQAIQSKDTNLTRELISVFESVTRDLQKCDRAKEFIIYAHTYFNDIEWNNSTEARDAVNKGMQSVSSDCPCFEIINHYWIIVNFIEDDEYKNIDITPVPLDNI